MSELMEHPLHKAKPLSDSTLLGMKKIELITIIRDCEHNYAALYETYQNAVAAAENMLKEMEERENG